MDEAERLAVELKEMIKKGFKKKRIRDYYYLAGRIKLERKNFDWKDETLESLRLRMQEEAGR